MTYKIKIQTSLIAVLLGLVMGSAAQAACSVAGNTATPFQAGPPNPNNGFAEYVRDASGLALELCTSPSQPTVDPATGAVISPVGTAPFCFFDPPDPANAFSSQIGFGAEGFWWLAQPDTAAFPATLNAVLVLGAEAAFGGEVPVDGDQFPFTRLRVRLDVPVPGFYRVTEPYGEHVYDIPAVAAGPEVFDSFDVQFAQGTIDAAGNVTEATVDTNCVGPWLTWDTFASNDPALDISGDGIPDFIGDGATSHLITGSPTGNNLFRLEAFADAALTIPLNTLDPGDADGNGSDSSVETDLFTVVGKIYDGRLATPMVAERTTYARDAAGAIGQVDVFTAGAQTAAVSFTGDPNVGGPFTLMTDSVGNFFDSPLLLPDAAVVPLVVEIDATDGGAATPTDPTHIVSPLVDLVTITRAEYDLSLVPPTLTVEAASSDTLVPPTLTVVELNLPLTAGRVAVTEAAPGVPLAPPGTVTVSSSAGGSATRLVEVIADLDGDGVADDVDNCPVNANPGQENDDSDSFGNACDNCTLVNNEDQCDTDGDDYGNICDGDFNNNNLVDPGDFSLLKSRLGSSTAPDQDMNCNGVVDPLDFSNLKARLATPPGPSGLNP